MSDLTKLAEPVAGTIKQAIYLETALSPEDIKTITDYMVKHEALAAELAESNKWREAVIDALVVSCIYTAEHDTDPRKAINDLVVWESQIALDPAVSSDAQALIDQGRAELAEVKKELAKALNGCLVLWHERDTERARAEKAEAALAKIESICTACVNRSGHIVTVLNNIESVLRGAKD